MRWTAIANASRLSRRWAWPLALVCVAVGCDDNSPSPAPSTATVATVEIVFRGPTARRGDLPASAQACVQGVDAAGRVRQ